MHFKASFFYILLILDEMQRKVGTPGSELGISGFGTSPAAKKRHCIAIPWAEIIIKLVRPYG
jgi:hypothetical protein